MWCPVAAPTSSTTTGTGTTQHTTHDTTTHKTKHNSTSQHHNTQHGTQHNTTTHNTTHNTTTHTKTHNTTPQHTTPEHTAQHNRPRHSTQLCLNNFEIVALLQRLPYTLCDQGPSELQGNLWGRSNMFEKSALRKTCWEMRPRAGASYWVKFHF